MLNNSLQNKIKEKRGKQQNKNIPLLELMNNKVSHRLPQVCLINRALEWVLGDVKIQQRTRSLLFFASECEFIDSFIDWATKKCFLFA
jgi:hypothetical protein